MGYGVGDLIQQLNSPYKRTYSDSYIAPALGTETIHLPMEYAQHDVPDQRTLDVSGNGNHADFVGSPTLEVAHHGRAYILDGVDDGHLVPYTASLSSGQFAISLLLRVDEDEMSGFPRIVEHGDGGNTTTAWHIRFNGANRDIGFVVYDTSGSSVAANLTRSQYSVNQWFRLSVEFDGSVARVWADDELIDTTSALAGTLKSSTEGLYIGHRKGGTQHAPISVKDVRFFPHALGQSGVESLLSLDHPSNNAKYVQAWHTAFWEVVDHDLGEVKKQAYVPTATGVFLERHGEPTQTARNPDEGDPSYRIRIVGARKRREGSVTVEDVIEMVGTVTGSPGPGNVHVIQNLQEDGSHEPAYIRVQFSTQFLSSKGFTNDQIPDVVAQIEEILQDTDAAGVRVEVLLKTGSTWGTATWDDEDSLWGA